MCSSTAVSSIVKGVSMSHSSLFGAPVRNPVNHGATRTVAPCPGISQAFLPSQRTVISVEDMTLQVVDEHDLGLGAGRGHAVAQGLPVPAGHRGLGQGLVEVVPVRRHYVGRV